MKILNPFLFLVKSNVQTNFAPVFLALALIFVEALLYHEAITVNKLVGKKNLYFLQIYKL